MLFLWFANKYSISSSLVDKRTQGKAIRKFVVSHWAESGQLAIGLKAEIYFKKKKTDNIANAFDTHSLVRISS